MEGVPAETEGHLLGLDTDTVESTVKTLSSRLRLPSASHGADYRRRRTKSTVLVSFWWGVFEGVTRSIVKEMSRLPPSKRSRRTF
eukprot:5517947-Pyramimonas_sp.AAC.1